MIRFLFCACSLHVFGTFWWKLLLAWFKEWVFKFSQKIIKPDAIPHPNFPAYSAVLNPVMLNDDCRIQVEKLNVHKEMKELLSTTSDSGIVENDFSYEEINFNKTNSCKCNGEKLCATLESLKKKMKT